MIIEESPELRDGVYALLQEAGVLAKVRAYLRAQVWALLHEQTLECVDPALQTPTVIGDGDLRVLSYLVKWLTDKGLLNTLALLELESGQDFGNLPAVEADLLSSPGTHSPGHSEYGAAFSDMSMEPLSDYNSPARTQTVRATGTVIPTQPQNAFVLKDAVREEHDPSPDSNLLRSNNSIAPGVSLGPDETSSAYQSPGHPHDLSFRFGTWARSGLDEPSASSDARRSALSPDPNKPFATMSSPTRASQKSLSLGSGAIPVVPPATLADLTDDSSGSKKVQSRGGADVRANPTGLSPASVSNPVCTTTSTPELIPITDSIATKPKQTLNSAMIEPDTLRTGILLERDKNDPAGTPASEEITFGTFDDLTLGVTLRHDADANYRYDTGEDAFDDFEL